MIIILIVIGCKMSSENGAPVGAVLRRANYSLKIAVRFKDSSHSYQLTAQTPIKIRAKD